MDEFIKNTLASYLQYSSEKQMYEKLLNLQPSSANNAELLDKLQSAITKITIIDSWFAILTPDEYFAIKHHLVNSMSWEHVCSLYEKEFGVYKTNRTFSSYQKSALLKIEKFISDNPLVIKTIIGHA